MSKRLMMSQLVVTEVSAIPMSVFSIGYFFSLTLKLRNAQEVFGVTFVHSKRSLSERQMAS